MKGTSRVRSFASSAVKSRATSRLLLTRGVPPLAMASVFGAHFSVCRLCLQTMTINLSPTLSHIHLSLGLSADDASLHGRLSHIHTLASLTVHRRRECTRQQQNQLPQRQLSPHRVACSMLTTLWARVKSPRRAQLCRFVLIFSRARVYICMLFFACM